MNKVIKFLFVTIFSLSCYSAQELGQHVKKVNLGGLDTILKKRYLRVLTTRNTYDYYISQGRSKGLQYEMAKEFTKYLNKKFKKSQEIRIVFEMIPVDFDQLIPMLNSGKGDIIAVGMTKTAERMKKISFTKAYRKVDEVIVTRKELSKKPWKDKTFHIQRDSSYYQSLKKVKSQIKIEQTNPNLHAGDIMDLIALGKYDYTLVNSFWAKTISKLHDGLHIIEENPFRKNVEISWAVRKNNKALLKELDSFLPKIKDGTLLGNLLGYKYFYDINRISNTNLNIKKSRISKYDSTIKKYAQKYNLDWRLLSALCYQESKFNQNIVNKWGAIGLFQVKQMTANEPYIAIPNIKGQENFENNIHAGVKYLAWIKNRYLDPKKQMSEESRLRMMMAAYNAGPRRLLQAINKAKKMGLDTNKWFRNVELAMLKLGYPEPVIYVSEINKHYVSYLLLGIN